MAPVPPQTMEHPRARGGIRAATRVRGVSVGSSPRAGRNPSHREDPGLSLRNIPARGEEPATTSSSSSATSEHPRARGGTSPPSQQSTLAEGASPRAGRNRPVVRAQHEAERSIPARGEESLGRPQARSG